LFWNFSNIGLILATLINWLLKPKCMLIHIFEIFFFCIQIQYDLLLLLLLRDLAVCMKTKHFIFLFFIFYFLFFIFYMFWRKPGILIPDLYLYNIKIQINIDQNAVKYLQKITSFWKKKLKNFFIIFFSKLGPTRPI
jgi:hypothetical protein